MNEPIGGLPTHARGDGWLTACGQDRANVCHWTDDPEAVTCPACTRVLSPGPGDAS